MLRDSSIDFVKVFATILVMNSHMHVCYGEYYFLASGGGIGDALFFLVSGYTLFLSKKELGFIDWFKRRLARIVPAVLAVGLVLGLVFKQEQSFIEVITARKYWFVQCIFLYYLLIYPVLRCKLDITKVFAVCLAITMLYLSFFCDFTGKGMIYGLGGYYRWILYFNFMLLGGVLARYTTQIKHHKYSSFALCICIFMWYGSIYFGGNSNWQLLSIIPLIGICYYLCQVGKSDFVRRAFKQKILGKILMIVGSLCLESYLIQRYIITDALNSMFPINVPIVMVMVLIGAYILHIIATMIMLIFDPFPFSWRQLFLGL